MKNLSQKLSHMRIFKPILLTFLISLPCKGNILWSRLIIIFFHLKKLLSMSLFFTSNPKPHTEDLINLHHKCFLDRDIYLLWCFSYLLLCQTVQVILMTSLIEFIHASEANYFLWINIYRNVMFFNEVLLEDRHIHLPCMASDSLCLIMTQDAWSQNSEYFLSCSFQKALLKFSPKRHKETTKSVNRSYWNSSKHLKLSIDTSFHLTEILALYSTFQSSLRSPWLRSSE